MYPGSPLSVERTSTASHTCGLRLQRIQRLHADMSTALCDLQLQGGESSANLSGVLREALIIFFIQGAQN